MEHAYTHAQNKDYCLSCYAFQYVATSLVPRLSSRAVDPLPKKISERKACHATDVTGRKEVERT